MKQPLPILFVGDADCEEFREPAMWLIEHGAVAAADCSAALAAIEGDFSPAVIVLAQRRPADFSARQIDQLRSAAPLARTFTLLGPWLEGETRTGKPLPATMRAYWHQWQTRFQHECAELQKGEESPWSLPVTCHDDERIGEARGDIRTSDQAEKTGLRIAIYTPHWETAQALSELCAQRGWRESWVRDAGDIVRLPADFVLFDCRRATAVEAEELAALKAAIGETPIAALVGFPRTDDVERLKNAGAAAIISKPFFADDVGWQIEQFLRPAAAW